MKFMLRAFALSLLIASTFGYAQTLINPANITSYPYTISKSGSYKLTGNVNSGSASAFVISASNVTFDLGGYTINGTLNCTGQACTSSNNQYTGISANANNVIIQNGIVNGYYTDVYNGQPGGVVQNIATSNSIFGIYTTYTAVRLSSATYSTYGIYAYYGNIEDSTASLNWSYNIVGYNSTVLHNTVAYTAYTTVYGLYLMGGVAGSNTVNSSYGSSGVDLTLTSGAISQKNNACTSGVC
jgi:hypothetical protein